MKIWAECASVRNCLLLLLYIFLTHIDWSIGGKKRLINNNLKTSMNS